MQRCFQTANQDVYQHGESVRDYYFKLIEMLESNTIMEGWRIPNWFLEYRKEILNSLMSKDIISEYTLFHDCGKPYCRTIDEFGKQHFPNHAEISYNTWLEVGGNLSVAKLIRMDMDIHHLKSCDIDEFIKYPEAITLLIAGLAEIHSNCQMFGGIGSESFKIKWKQIDKRGKAICNKLFGRIK